MSLLSVNKKGKFIIGGIVAFALIATASTGLAAWVIGQQTGDDTSGNIAVDTVILDRSVSVTLGECETNIYFGPDRYNEDAFVSAGSQEEANLVDLEFTIAGTVTHGAAVTVDTVNIDVVFPEAALNSEIINIPSNSSDATITVGEDSINVKRYTVAVENGSFSSTLAFTWESNPCEAFEESKDAEAAAAAIETLFALNGEEYQVYVSAVVTDTSNAE